MIRPQSSALRPAFLTHLGAKNCVTGSCHLMQTAVGVNILLDCGKAYGRDPELPFDQFPVQPRDMDFLFLTHAHIDHIGRVPDFIDAGFRGEIICTHATKALLIPMLHDAMSFSDRTDKEVQRMEGLIDIDRIMHPVLLEAIMYFEFRLEIQNETKKSPGNPENPV